MIQKDSEDTKSAQPLSESGSPVESESADGVVTETPVLESSSEALSEAVPVDPDPITEGSDHSLDESEASSLIPSRIESQISQLEAAFVGLDKRFQEQFVANNRNEGIIDKLWAELQGHKDGLAEQLLKPILTDLVLLRDALDQTLEKLPTREGLTIEKALRTFESFPADVVDILERQGLEEYCAEVGEIFDPSRHTVLKKVSTGDAAQDKLVVESLRPGYIWNGRVFRSNQVIIHVFSPPKSEDETSNPNS